MFNFSMAQVLFPSSINITSSPTPLQPHTRKLNDQPNLSKKLCSFINCAIVTIHKSNPTPLIDKR